MRTFHPTLSILRRGMILHVHKDRVDSLDMDSVANDFVSQNSSRENLFGTFWCYIVHEYYTLYNHVFFHVLK